MATVGRASPIAGDRPHLAKLDGFRALSILAVLAAHMAPLGPETWRLNSASGHMGMSVFFVLSGFLITGFLWERRSIRDFLIRRFDRIMPSILLVSTVFCVILAQRPESFLALNLYYFNYDDNAIFPALSPLWSVALEMQFYVAIALIVMMFGRKGLWLIPVLALLVTGTRVMEGTFSSIRTHLRADEILAGCLLALVWVNRDQVWAARAGRVMAVGFWAFVVLWALSCWPPSGALGYLRPYFAAAMVGGVLFWRETWVHRMLSTRVLVYIAATSFALYVWHSPFRFGWFNPDDVWQKYLIARPLGLASTFAIAHVSTFHFELVVNRWAKKMTRKPRSIEAEA
jgi:peptidoglycan/LPS O-acetylase OafA/YrhL